LVDEERAARRSTVFLAAAAQNERTRSTVFLAAAAQPLRRMSARARLSSLLPLRRMSARALQGILAAAAAAPQEFAVTAAHAVRCVFVDLLLYISIDMKGRMLVLRMLRWTNLGLFSAGLLACLLIEYDKGMKNKDCIVYDPLNTITR
jgi:hypothetical protein